LLSQKRSGEKIKFLLKWDTIRLTGKTPFCK
jgi:hypothetical protein